MAKCPRSRVIVESVRLRPSPARILDTSATIPGRSCPTTVTASSATAAVYGQPGPGRAAVASIAGHEGATGRTRPRVTHAGQRRRGAGRRDGGGAGGHPLGLQARAGPAVAGAGHRRLADPGLRGDAAADAGGAGRPGVVPLDGPVAGARGPGGRAAGGGDPGVGPPRLPPPGPAAARVRPTAAGPLRRPGSP